MEEKVKYWKDLSDYDLETAIAMLETKRYLYVGFMCHQVIEKIFKALYSKNFSDTPPFSHSLSYLAKKGGFYDQPSDEQKNIVDQIEPLNIETRYPVQKERILKGLSEMKCIEIIEQTRGIQEWIKKRL